MSGERIGAVNRRRLLDSFALLAYLNQERGFEFIKSALAKAQKSDIFVMMNEINIGESYYILFRKRGKEKADYFLENILPGLPITTVSNDFQQVIGAARIKSEYSLSFADCFAVATAHRESATILTGDPEFKKIEHLVEVEWILS
jgi:predicted nucleic acid-binding protein